MDTTRTLRTHLGYAFMVYDCGIIFKWESMIEGSPLMRNERPAVFDSEAEALSATYRHIESLAEDEGR